METTDEICSDPQFYRTSCKQNRAKTYFFM